MIIDASVFIAAAVGEETDHRVAKAFLEAISLKPRLVLHLPEIVLVEIACGLARQSNNREESIRYAQVVEQMVPLNFYPLDRALRQQAIVLGTQYRLRAADSIYLALAHMIHVPLVTLDREQLTRSPKDITVLLPQEAISTL